MKGKFLKLYKEYKLAFKIAALIILLGIAVIITYLAFFTSNKIKTYSNDIYTIKYDNSWKIDKKEASSIILKHNKNTTLNIEVVTLEDEYRYIEIDNILDELLYDIKQQNKNYKLLSKEKISVTKNNYDGYQILYENNEIQVLVTITKKSDKLIMFIYESANEYFDILLDSAQNIIYEFNTKENKFKLNYKLNINEKDISWQENNQVVKSLNKVSDYDIASSNYLVNYSIPTSFKQSNINSSSQYYNYNDSDIRISITANIYNRNIYQYIDPESSISIYSNYNYIRKNTTDYLNFKEEITKQENAKNLTYIYKNSYKSNSSFGTSDYEEVEVIYELDKAHIFVINIKGTDTNIPKELVEKIKVNSSKNYSSYVTSKVKDGFLISELKRYSDYNRDSIDKITLKIPEQYKELDKGYNIYENRFYGLNYDYEIEKYKYEVEYYLTSTSSKIESQVELVNNSFTTGYGVYKYLTHSGEKTLNNKKISIYDGGYTTLSGILFNSEGRNKLYVNVKVLFYELPNGGYLRITIEGIESEISDELLNSLTNFEIEKENI